jgi:gliding motility-associated lipoprotein GldH
MAIIVAKKRNHRATTAQENNKRSSRKMRTIGQMLSIFLLFIVACDNRSFYEHNVEMEADIWKKENPARFSFDISSTKDAYNLYVNLRNTGEYEYSNIFLFLTLTAPDGKHSTDTLECLLADDKGKWFGKGGVNLLDNRILYKKNIQFPAKGTYQVLIEQGMRAEHLQHIRNVGFRLETAE